MEFLCVCSDFSAVTVSESRMPSTVRQFKTINAEAQIAAAYNEAGYRYGKYADGRGRTLFTFDGRHSYGDRKSWEAIEHKLLGLRARGLKRLRVLDIGCGPGTWLRRVVVRARQIGFEEIIARGVDIAEAQLHRARLLSRGLCELKGVQLTYGYGDLRGEIDAPQADICLCLYGVLNHVPVADLPDVMGRMAALTAGYFVATVRAVGSQPTVYVDEVSAALRFHQDNLINRLDVEFANGRRATFQSHLFSRTELTQLVSLRMEIEDIRGLDLFHGRFANDPRWNPKCAVPLGRLSQELERLEKRYCRDPGFVDHAAHLLVVAKSPGMARR
jgi:SAM-dependent methyltransferase